MNKTVFKIIRVSWGFNSLSEEKYIGTIDELKNITYFKSILKDKRPRTINGLQKLLNEYAKKHKTTYTGISFDVYTHYGEYEAGLQK